MVTLTRAPLSGSPPSTAPEHKQCTSVTCVCGGTVGECCLGDCQTPGWGTGTGRARCSSGQKSPPSTQPPALQRWNAATCTAANGVVPFLCQGEGREKDAIMFLLTTFLQVCSPPSPPPLPEGRGG
eukprot:scaffold4111_cov19-Tisochrysis_lutea.AAC.1